VAVELEGPTLDSTRKVPRRQLPDDLVDATQLAAAIGTVAVDPTVDPRLDTLEAQVAALTAALVAKAPLLDPVFTGDPTAPTRPLTDNDDTLATTAFAQGINGLPDSAVWFPQPGGTQLLRATKTTRTDVRIVWMMPTEPSKAAGYALNGDLWCRILV
jgi:hypothetical protein